jgi:uncharacterized phage-like protein YoqJ
MIPGCCGLKTIHMISCLSKADEFSKKETAMFDDMVKDGKAQEGQWNTYGKALDTIAIITDSKRYNTPEQFTQQKKFFEDKGWKLLVTWKSHESGGKNYMYGSPEMTPAAAPEVQSKVATLKDAVVNLVK